MIVLNSAIIENKVLMGRLYDEDKKEFLDITVSLSQAEINMLYKGDILLNEIVDNCIVGKPNHKMEKTKPEDVEDLLKEEYIKERLKPYLREDRLNNLGI